MRSKPSDQGKRCTFRVLWGGCGANDVRRRETGVGLLTPTRVWLICPVFDEGLVGGPVRFGQVGVQRSAWILGTQQFECVLDALLEDVVGEPPVG